jgi:hypothetical protein
MHGLLALVLPLELQVVKTLYHVSSGVYMMDLEGEGQSSTHLITYGGIGGSYAVSKATDSYS